MFVAGHVFTSPEQVTPRNSMLRIPYFKEFDKPHFGTMPCERVACAMPSHPAPDKLYANFVCV
jgi:hypothetical protein